MAPIDLSYCFLKLKNRLIPKLLPVYENSYNSRVHYIKEKIE